MATTSPFHPPHRLQVPVGSGSWRVAALVFVLFLFGLPGAASAQDAGDSKAETTEQLIKDYEDESKSGARERLPAPGISRVNLELNWRHWQQSLREGEPKTKLLNRLVTDTRTFGYRNATTYSAATVQALLRQSDSEAPSAEQAIETLRAARTLTPDLPYAALSQAEYLAKNHPLRLSDLFGAYYEGLSRSIEWPNTFALLAAYLLVALLVAVAAGIFALLVGQTIRHTGIVAHDVARLLPKPVTRGQIVAAVAIGLVALFTATQSFLLAGLALLALASITQNWRERVTTGFAALVVAAVPQVEGRLVEYAQFSEHRVRPLLEAQYLRCDDECIDRLEGRFDKQPDDLLTGYTLALARLRAGTASNVDRALEILDGNRFESTSFAGRARTLKGAAQLAAGNASQAISTLQRATNLVPDTTPPWFNLMRAYRRTGEDKRASRASKQASRRDVDAVQRKTSIERSDPASYLMLPTVPLATFWKQYRERRRTSGSPVETRGPLTHVWRRLAGPMVPMERAPMLGFGMLVLLVLTAAFPLTGIVSSPCPNCGLAREPEDPERTGGHPHCLPCYRTFVGGAELGYRARVHYETLLGRRSTLQTVLRRSLTVLVPGSGHALAGRALAGFALAATVGAGIFFVVAPEWLWQPPRSIAGVDWLGLQWAGWGLAGLGALIALWSAWTDLRPVEASDDAP